MKNNIKMKNDCNTKVIIKGNIRITTKKIKNDINGNPRYTLNFFINDLNCTEKLKGILGRYTKNGLNIQSYNLNADINFILEEYNTKINDKINKQTEYLKNGITEIKKILETVNIVTNKEEFLNKLYFKINTEIVELKSQLIEL
jgi:hypothetical protein